MILKLGDKPAQGGLRQVHLLGGARDRAKFHDRNGRFKLFLV